MHAEHKAVGLVLVVILGHGEVDFVLDAAAGELEIVLEHVVLAAALAWSRCVAHGVAECVSLLTGGYGACLLELQGYRRVEVSECGFQRLESGSGNTKRVPVAGFQKGFGRVVLANDAAELRTVCGKTDGFDCAADANFCEESALAAHALPQIDLARAEQILPEDQIPRHVENAHLHRSIATLCIVQHPVIDADVPRLETAGRQGNLLLFVRQGDLLLFVEGEFAIFISLGGISLGEEFHESTRNGASALVGDCSGQLECRSRRKRRCQYNGEY